MIERCAMLVTLRWAMASLLLAIVMICIYLSIAVPEAPRDSWWGFWYIYGLIGLNCLLGAFWLIRGRATINKSI